MLHERGFHVVGGQDAVLLAVHGLREEAEGFLNLALFLRGDVVLLGELRLSRLGRGGRTAGFALRRLFFCFIVNLAWGAFHGCFFCTWCRRYGTYHVKWAVLCFCRNSKT